MTTQAQGTPVPAIFNFESHPVRSLLIDDWPWFVAIDVCRAMQLPRTAIRRLDANEKGRCLMRTPSGDQEISVINESGLYALLLLSCKPQARKFAKWVMTEVLPALRSAGTCCAPQRPRGELAQRWIMWFDARGQLQTHPIAAHMVLLNPACAEDIGDLINEHIPSDLLPAVANVAHHRIMWELTAEKASKAQLSEGSGGC